jgi:hypothetical protein
MSERITEAELRELYERNRGLPQSNTYSLAVMQLVAEVRRLRGLIVALETDEEQDLVDIPGLRGLDAEARAIREEQMR